MDRRQEELPFDAVLEIAGPFDAPAATRLRSFLVELPPGRSVMLDFSHARDISDLALAVLAMALRGPQRPRVLLTGMMRHQERMLRYLGVDGPVVEPRGAGDLPG
jgi:STAS domain-containing protein